MTQSEREARGLLLAAVLALAGYATWLLIALRRAPVDRLDPVGPAVTVSIALTWMIVGSRLWARHATDPEDRRPDERDRDVSRRAGTWAFLFLAAAVAGISVWAVDGSPRWISAVLFLSLLLSAVVFSAAATVLYRRRLS